MKELSEEVVRIAKLAGAKILEIYADESLFGIEVKSDESPLTQADKAANDIIIEGLSALSVDYPIISEETKLKPFSERKHYKKFWLVDPLDGTKEFIKRNGDFTVNIALVEDGAPIMGVVFIPVTGEVYWGIKGSGAFHQDESGETKKLQANAYSMSDKGLRVVCSRSHINADTQQFIDQLEEPESVSRGSSLKFLLIASGQAEVYPRMGPTMEWDTGAAQIVLEEAGGQVLHHVTLEPLKYNKENLLNPYFIAQAKLS